MTYTITITEVCRGSIDIEAESYEKALEKAEDEYWKAPNDYVLEPTDTYFQ